MAQITYIASTVLMGLLVAGVLATILSRTRWRDYEDAGVGPGATERMQEVLSSPTTWMVGFLALVALFGVGAVIAVGGMSLPAGSASMAGVGLAVFFAGLLGLLIFLGAYTASRSRGHPSSFAAAEGAGLLGMFVLVAIVVKLVTGI
jgi:hypothetical protein